MNCECCNYLCSDIQDWHSHVTSEGHVEKAKVTKPQPFAEIPPPVLAFTVTPVNSGPSSMPSAPPLLSEAGEVQIQDKQNEDAVRKILAKNQKEWKCVNCNVICQSFSSWEGNLKMSLNQSEISK